MSIIRTAWECAFSPKLYKIQETTWKSYEANGFERWGDHVITSFVAIWSISLYALPFIATYMYRRSYSMTESACSLTKIVAGAGFILIASLAVRGYARASNPAYLKFIKTLNKAKKSYNYESKQDLLKYDFEFWAWPADFHVTSIDRPDGRKRIMLTSSRGTTRRGKDLLLAVPCKIISYVVAHTIALKLMYPGSMTILNMALKAALIQGRTDLIDMGGQRCKIITFEKLEIDAMFVDRRSKSGNGNFLVITCEGNCGFYETGIMVTPLNKGYSVLGWNHPGFGGSTGAPYPPSEIDAIDAVMRFAKENLSFSEDQIILYGWSIGGYTSTWAAMNYPQVHGLVLDATFDDILPLATSRMPTAIDSIVRNVIREHLNLAVAEQLKRYDGRVLLVRRTDDEIMCTPTSNLIHNRANMLLTKLLMHRYPQLFVESGQSLEVLTQYLGKPTHDTVGSTTRPLVIRTQHLFENASPVNESLCIEKITDVMESDKGDVKYPSTLGQDCDSLIKQQLVIYLANKYMEDQASQHCAPLVPELFHPGWDPRTLHSKTS